MEHIRSEYKPPAIPNGESDLSDEQSSENNGQLRAHVPPDLPPPASIHLSVGEGISAGESAPDHGQFQLAGLRLSQVFEEKVGVRKLLTTVPVRKPMRQEFVRTHPDESYRFPTTTLELRDEREFYLVAPELWEHLASELKPTLLVTAVNRQGVLYIWPVRLPDTDGRVDRWCASALAAADRAKACWVRVMANMALGAYEVFEATAELPGPRWPGVAFESLMEIAFKERFIRSLDHPVICRLRGKL